MKEKYFLVVRFHVAPQAEKGMVGWLQEGGHIREVSSQPGFLWSKFLRIAPNAEGWNGYAMIYGISSKEDFQKYESNASLKAKFAKERAPFEKFLKIDRFSGEVVA